MAAVRNILKHCRFETAKSTRTCDVSDSHVIASGSRHFAYEEVPGQRKNICMACAPAVLAAVQEHLTSLVDQL